MSFVKLDITDNDSVQAGIKEAADALGVIDIAVNTAGELRLQISKAISTLTSI